jgi:hypothetical protein
MVSDGLPMRRRPGEVMQENDLWGISGEVKNAKDLKGCRFVEREVAGKVLEMMVQVVVADGAPVFFNTILMRMHHRYKGGEQIRNRHKCDKYGGPLFLLQMHGLISN